MLWFGLTVIGSRITKLDARFTFRTSSAWLIGSMLRWSTPIPPDFAMAIAISLSVTVSIAADTKGTLSERLRVNCVLVLTALGRISLLCGSSSTSSKVKYVGIAAILSTVDCE